METVMDAFHPNENVVGVQTILRHCQQLSWSEWILFRRMNFPWKALKLNDRNSPWRNVGVGDGLGRL